MNLRDLVEVNQQGMVHSSINFGLMDKPETNLELCKSYVFNYDRAKPTDSTIGVLDRVRRSFHSRNEPNIHCMVMQYGKGKSHFALVLANFLGKVYDSPEVQGILSQIKSATVGHAAIGESLDSFKKNLTKPYLVLCLSGDSGTIDLRKQFLDKLLQVLNQDGIDTTALNQCAAPLEYLERLSITEEERANQWLEDQEKNCDIQSLIQSLRQNIVDVIPTVKDVCKHLNGFSPDFTDNINIEALLTTVVESYCTGDNAPYKGVLIVFDELNYYLKRWLADPIKAGDTAIQNITNICEVYKGRVALLGFTQIKFKSDVGVSAEQRESFNRLTTRLAPQDTTYYPQSSLELVIDNLIVQKEDTDLWQQFEQKWRETFSAEARYLYEGSGKRYLKLGWTEQQIRQHLSAGVFPLHPYTTYLLANLSFAQDRTAIEFLRGTVTEFVASQPAEALNGSKPNYLYATTLVENFLDNYGSTFQEQYRTARQILSGSDNEDEYEVIRALFLFFASEEKLAKSSDQEDHQVILGHLTGLSRMRLDAALDRLTNHYRAIHYNKASKLYSFYQGVNPRELELEIKRRAETQDSSIEDVVRHAQGRLKDYLKADTLPGLQFVQEKRLVQEDWQFELRFVSPEQLNRYLTNAHSLQNLTQKGIVLYVLAETQDELQHLQRTIGASLEKSPVGDRIVVGLPGLETGNLDRLLIERQEMSKMERREREEYGEAFTQLLKQYEKDIQIKFEQILGKYHYFCQRVSMLTAQQQQQAHSLISHLLQQRYPFVPPIQSNDKLRSNHVTGRNIVRFVSQKLFCNALNDQNLNGVPQKSAYDTVIQGVYCQCWGLLRYTGGKYQVQPPTHPVLQEAWNLINERAKQAKAANKGLPLIEIWNVLKDAPYGYSEYNFVVLLAAWLSHHHKTVLLKGRKQLSGRQSIPVETQPLRFWAETDIFTNPITLVEQWIGLHRATIVFRDGPVIPDPLKFPASWEDAHKYLEAVERCLKSDETSPEEFKELSKQKQTVTQAYQVVEQWFSPVITAESLVMSADLPALIAIYPKLWDATPPVDMSGKACVTPSQDQRDRQKTAQIQIRDRLEQLLTQNIATLPTIADCQQRVDHIQQLQQHLGTLSEQSPAFAASLNKALGEATERQKTLKTKKTTSFLESQLQAFLQRHPQTNVPLHSHEKALQELGNLHTQLQNSTTTNPQDKLTLTDALNQCREQIQQQISALNSRFELLQTGLATIGNRASFNACQQTYTELAVLYKGSSQEQASKALGDRLQKLGQDLDRLDKLQADLNACQSIAECDRLQDKITQLTTQLNAPDQFQKALSTLQQKTSDRAKIWVQTLETQAQKLQNLTSLTEAQSYQADLFALRPRYQGSAEESRFIALQEAFTPWLDFFQRLDTNPGNTLEQCQAKLKVLNHWHQQQPELSPALQDLYRNHHHDLEQDIARLTEGHKTQALHWWQQLNQESAQIASLEGSQRFKLARTIQKNIREGWAKYGRFIPEKKAEGEDLYQRCNQVLDEEKIDRIKQLFLEIRRSDRPQLLKELHTMVHAETEVF